MIHRISILARAFLISTLIFSFGVVLPKQADAKSTRVAQKKKTAAFAVFPAFSTKKATKQTAKKLSQIIKEALDSSGLHVLMNEKLKKSVKSSPLKLVKKCGLSASCLTALARKAGAKTIVAFKVSGSKKTPEITIISVSAQKGKTLHQIKFKVSKSETIRSALAPHFKTIFGVKCPKVNSDLAALGDLSLELPPEIPEVKTETKPDTTTTTANAEKEATQPKTDTTTAPKTDTAVATPAKTPADKSKKKTETTAEAQEPADDLMNLEMLPIIEAMPADATALAAAPSTPARPPRSQSLSKALRYGGLALAGIGVIAVSGGAYYGMLAMDLEAEIEDDEKLRLATDPNAWTGQEALDKQKDQHSAADRANLLLMSGGTLALIGGTLFAVDILLGPVEAKTEVSVGAGPSSLFLNIKF